MIFHKVPACGCGRADCTGANQFSDVCDECWNRPIILPCSNKGCKFELTKEQIDQLSSPNDFMKLFEERKFSNLPRMHVPPFKRKKKKAK